MAIAVARTFRALLFEIQPVDAGSLIVGAALLLLVAMPPRWAPPAGRRASTRSSFSARTDSGFDSLLNAFEQPVWEMAGERVVISDALVEL